jgi:hypothetical protein
MPRRKLPKKTPAEDAISIEGLSAFNELVKAKIASNHLKELAENMDLMEFRHLVAWMEILRDERDAAAKRKQYRLQHPRVTRKV